MKYLKAYYPKEQDKSTITILTTAGYAKNDDKLNSKEVWMLCEM